MIEGFKNASLFDKWLVFSWVFPLSIQAASNGFMAAFPYAFIIILSLRELELEHLVRKLGGKP